MEKKLYDMNLSNKAVKRLLIYFIIIFILGISATLTIFAFEDSISFISSKSMYAILGSSGMSLVGSSLCYIRKIYTSCINDRFKQVEENDSLNSAGNIIYFIFRPLFGLAFVLLFVVGLKSGILYVTFNGINNLSNGFAYICMFISFFIGYKTGRLLDICDELGSNIINKIFHMEEGNK